MVEEQVEGAAFLALGRGGDVLGVGHQRGEIEKGAAQGGGAVENHVEAYLFRETAVQQLKFCCGVHRVGLVFLLQVGVQYIPEGPHVGAFRHRESLMERFAQTAPARFRQAGTTVHQKGRRHVAHTQPRSAYIDEGVEVFFGGIAVVDVGNSLVYHLLYSFGTEILVQFGEYLAGLCCGHPLAHHQPAVGQPLMRVECVAAPVGGKQGHRLAPLAEEQRVVGEAVAVVVHIAAVEEKGAVARLRHQLVPALSFIGGVGSYCYHFPALFSAAKVS